jgi:integrase
MRKRGTPALRRHKPTGQAVVTLSGKDIYLGVWPAEQEEAPTAIKARYHREVSEWEARGRQHPPVAAPVTSPDAANIKGALAQPGEPLSVAELILAFMRHADGYYQHRDGTPTSEVHELALSLRPVNHLYGKLPATDFGPLKLKAVRELMVSGYEHPSYGEQAPLCRRVVNARVRRIGRCFKWAVGEELLAVEIYHALKAVPGLKKGRTTARESSPVQPVAPEHVEAVLPLLTLRLAGAVRFQQHTGARPGEALAVRLCDIDRTGPVWIYRPLQHKTAHQDRTRAVAIGPKGQAVLRDFICIRCPLCGIEGRPPRIGSRDGILCGPCTDRVDEEGIAGPFERCEVQQPDICLFSPAEAMRERDEDRRARRKSKVQLSQLCRKKNAPKRKPGARYATQGYARAIARCCEAAGIPHWHPNQLRHLHATEVRKRHGLEAAQVALGHATAAVTQVYAQRDHDLAIRVALAMG